MSQIQEVPISSRPGFIVDHTVPADGGESPNKYADLVSVQVRVHWPPLAPYSDVREAIIYGLLKAIQELDETCDIKYKQGAICHRCKTIKEPSHWTTDRYPS